MVWWSAACALHGLARSYSFLLEKARFFLGMGEGGGFPAATRVVAEWMPVNQRSTAMGIINAGTAIGSVPAPPLLGLRPLLGIWRCVFFLSAGVGLPWAAGWFAVYRQSTQVASQEMVSGGARFPGSASYPPVACSAW